MKKLLFVLVGLMVSMSCFAEIKSPIFQDTVGIRNYIISELSNGLDYSIQEHQQYVNGLVNEYLDKELPNLHKILNLYDELAMEYQSLSNDNKPEFLQKNKLKIMGMGFKEITTISSGDRIFNPDIREKFHKAACYRLMSETCEYLKAKIDDDVESYISYMEQAMQFGVRWIDFIKGFRKFGFKDEVAVKMANNSHLYEDVNGMLKYYPPTKSTPKKTKRKNRRK